MDSYTDSRSYLEALRERGKAPEGFRFAVTRIQFFPAEREISEPLPMNLSAAVLDRPTESFAGVFTRNQFPGAPVIVGRELLGKPAVSGVLVNNKIANVCAPGGVDTAKRIAERFASVAGCPGTPVFPASTGIIGWSLPENDILDALEPLSARLGTDGPVDMARGIMTTDSFPKLRSAEVGDGRIVGVAKGAGMIEPNCATLLVFLFTDVSIGRASLQRCLSSAVAGSFNTISVDGDQSTSDMVLAFSSNLKSPVDERMFSTALSKLCYDLSMDVVRNGEGTEHVIRVLVDQAPNEDVARACAKAVVNSPLVKTAICGNDPNVGRILGAIGDYAGSNGIVLDRGRVVVSIGGETVFSDGEFALNPEREVSIARYLSNAALDPGSRGYPAHERNVEIHISLGLGDSSGEASGSDLTHGYVSENADYRS